MRVGSGKQDAIPIPTRPSPLHHDCAIRRKLSHSGRTYVDWDELFHKLFNASVENGLERVDKLLRAE